jgi:uncharacterized membrane protein
MPIPIVDEPTSRQATFAIAGITLLAMGLRLFRIDAQSAWVDEAFTVHAAAGRWEDMMRILVGDFSHPPLHTMLVRWWFAPFEVSVLSARLLSALFGTLAVPALYWLGTLLFDRRTALIASFLLAISQLGIVYSQEARGYSLLLLLVIVAAGFFVRSFRAGGIRDFVCFVVVVSLLIYTHYYSIFAVAGLLIYALAFRGRSSIPMSWWAAASVATSVAYLPWLASGVIDSVIRNPENARVEGVLASLASPLYSLNWFNNGKIDGIREQAPLWTFPVGCLLFTAPAVWALWLGSQDRKTERQAEILLALLWFVPIGAVAALGLFRLVYDVRHVSFAVAAYYLLVARGMTLVSSTTLRGLLIAGIVGYWGVSFRATYFIPFKENYRDAFAALLSQARTGDCMVYGAPDGQSYGEWYWTSYHHGQTPPTVVPLAQLALRSDCRRLWLLWDGSFWKGGPLTYDAATATLGPSYVPGRKLAFLGVDLQLFVRQE